MLTNIGHQLIEGLWNGINNAVGWIMDKLNGFKDAVLNGLKSLFGIHSPSTLFRDEIGKNLALGIGEGFSNSMQSVASKMQNVSQGLASSIYGSLQSNISSAVLPVLSSGYSPTVAMAGGGYYSNSVTTSTDNSTNNPLTVIFQGNNFGNQQISDANVKKISNALVQSAQRLGVKI